MFVRASAKPITLSTAMFFARFHRFPLQTAKYHPYRREVLEAVFLNHIRSGQFKRLHP